MNKMDRLVARRRRAGERGFTLIELLVVIAVLAILAAVVIFNVVGVSNKGNSSSCATDVKSVQTAVDAYVNDNPSVADPFSGDIGTLPASKAAGNGSNIWNKLVPNYLHTIPTISECKVTAMSLAYANTSNATNGYTVDGK